MGASSGAELVALSFERYLGSFGGTFVGGATVLFALTTVLGWSYYGERCVSYLSKEKEVVRKGYKVIFVAAVMVGSLLDVKIVWDISDMFNGIMMVPNLIAIILLSDVVISETKKERLRTG